MVDEGFLCNGLKE